jgi:small nuclear ribonucleoprotein (snRNP)-like protein
VASIFAMLVNKHALINASENVYYDFLQRKITIDTKSDERFQKNASLFSSLVFINIDSACINSQTDRVKKQCITDLLDTLAVHKNSLTSLFLDYDLSYVNQTDTLLWNSLNKFEGQLLIPRLLFANRLLISVKNPVPDSLIVSNTDNNFIMNASAYAFGWKENYTHTYRYYLYRIFTPEMNTYNSVPYIIAQKLWPSHNLSFDEHSLDDMKEIKYVLRNNDVPLKERAVMVYSMSDVIKQIPHDELESLLKNKMVFVGLFENYTNKYNQQPDSYITPVNESMSGVLITVNAFLNLMMQNYIKTDTGAISSLFILLFVFLGSLWHYVAKQSRTYSGALLWYFIFIVSSVIGVLLLSNFFWVGLNIRIHFVNVIIAVLLSWPVLTIFRNKKKN